MQLVSSTTALALPQLDFGIRETALYMRHYMSKGRIVNGQACSGIVLYYARSVKTWIDSLRVVVRRVFVVIG